MTSPTTARAILVALLACTALAACGDDDDGGHAADAAPDSAVENFDSGLDAASCTSEDPPFGEQRCPEGCETFGCDDQECTQYCGIHCYTCDPTTGSWSGAYIECHRCVPDAGTP